MPVGPFFLTFQELSDYNFFMDNVLEFKDKKSLSQKVTSICGAETSLTFVVNENGTSGYVWDKLNKQQAFELIGLMTIVTSHLREEFFPSNFVED